MMNLIYQYDTQYEYKSVYEDKWLGTTYYFVTVIGSLKKV